MTSMVDGWSPGLEHLTARRFLTMHRDDRRCRQCDPDGQCRHLAWAVKYFRKLGQATDG